jgi:hypothetical protein
MLMKKKEMLKKRKRKADIDIINDNDDIIDQLLADMRHAAEVSNCGTLLQIILRISTFIKVIFTKVRIEINHSGILIVCKLLFDRVVMLLMYCEAMQHSLYSC